MMTNATHGCRAVSSRSSGETVSRAANASNLHRSSGAPPRRPPRDPAAAASPIPSRTCKRLCAAPSGRAGVSSPSNTPATVGWTPDFKHGQPDARPDDDSTPAPAAPRAG